MLLQRPRRFTIRPSLEEMEMKWAPRYGHDIDDTAQRSGETFNTQRRVMAEHSRREDATGKKSVP